jgi:hypothetical protein
MYIKWSVTKYWCSTLVVFIYQLCYMVREDPREIARHVTDIKYLKFSFIQNVQFNPRFSMEFIASKFLCLKHVGLYLCNYAVSRRSVTQLRLSIFCDKLEHLPSGYPCRHQFILHATSRVSLFLLCLLCCIWIVEFIEDL